MNVPKQMRAAVNTRVPTMKADITAPAMTATDSWVMTKAVKVRILWYTDGDVYYMKRIGKER